MLTDHLIYKAGVETDIENKHLDPNCRGGEMDELGGWD